MNGQGQRPAGFDATACPIIARHIFGVEPFRLIGDVVAGVVAEIAVECGKRRRGLNDAPKTAGTSGHRPLGLGIGDEHSKSNPPHPRKQVDGLALCQTGTQIRFGE